MRASLVARLLKDRGVARFIVAPDGYGKSSLALDYAETVFEWLHTFWVNAQSPCFIRDLDAGIVARSCLDFDTKAALVVIDDLPPLDDARSKSLSQQIDTLLAEGCEVLVTCVPSCDISGQLQRDRIRLEPADLLLSDEELATALSSKEDSEFIPEDVAEAFRVPICVWGSPEQATSFPAWALREELPADMLLHMATMLVLQKGANQQLRQIFEPDTALLDAIRNDYPHIGVGEELDSFEGAPGDAADIMHAVKPVMDALVKRSLFATRAELIRAWADVLLAAGNAARACEVVRVFGTNSAGVSWLLANCREVVRQGCFYPGLLIARKQRGTSGGAKVQLMAYEALCRRMLGDEVGALRCAKRYAFQENAPLAGRVCSALIVLRLGGSADSHAALHVLQQLGDAECQGLPASESFWRRLAYARTLAHDTPEALTPYWEECAQAGAAGGADDDFLALLASWVFQAIGQRSTSPSLGLGVAEPFPPTVERYVRGRLTGDASPRIDFLIASAGLSMEEAHARGVPYNEGPLPATVLFSLRQIEMSVLAQRGVLEKSRAAELSKRSIWMDNTPAEPETAPFAPGPKTQRRVPLLTLRFFGSFEVAIGDTVIDPKRFKRQNVRSLLVLLAVAQGKEVHRDELSHAMWPTTDMDTARKNFYTVWAQLRKALSLPDGSCPYLNRNQHGCSLEQRLVRSDIVRFNEICRELIFGVPDVDRWQLLFRELDTDFGTDLMPSESTNTLVVHAREDYRARLIDALVAATANVIDAGHPQWGIWFARTALGHDETREDAYMALMQAQVACKQRTAAMTTFLKCRAILGERLGIDPSPETLRLYESLLD